MSQNSNKNLTINNGDQLSDSVRDNNVETYNCHECGGRFLARNDDYKYSYKLHSSSGKHKRWKKNKNQNILSGSNQTSGNLNALEYNEMRWDIVYNGNDFYCIKCETNIPNYRQTVIHFRSTSHKNSVKRVPDYFEMIKYHERLKSESANVDDGKKIVDCQKIKNEDIKGNIGKYSKTNTFVKSLKESNMNSTNDENVQNNLTKERKENNYILDDNTESGNEQNTEMIFSFQKLLDNRSKTMWWSL